MNFKKIYEDYNVTYEKGNNGPFEKWSTSISSGKEQKPIIKGTPHFDYEKASLPSTNKPSCPYENDTYNVKYSKCGCLTESEFDELEDDDLLDDDFYDEEYIADEDDFDEIFDPDEEIDEEDQEDRESREFEDWKYGLDNDEEYLNNGIGLTDPEDYNPNEDADNDGLNYHLGRDEFDDLEDGDF